jgi:hypothetical protein
MDHLSAHFFTTPIAVLAGGGHRLGSKAGLLQSSADGRNRLIQSFLCFFSSFHSILDVQKDTSHNGAPVRLQLKCELIL